MKDILVENIKKRSGEILDIGLNLLKIPCETDSQNTKEVMDYVRSIFEGKTGIEIESYSKKEGLENLVISLKGEAGEGKKTLAFNGHVDTFPVGDRAEWIFNPFGEVTEEGRLYGRGAADMKGAVAAYLFMMLYLWEHRKEWKGTLKLILVGDEQTGGTLGTKFLLAEAREAACADSLINGDMGSPYIIRTGEKGLLWIELKARGKSGHGAFVHDGVNAIDMLMKAVEEIRRGLSLLEPSEDGREMKKIIEASHDVLQYHGLPREADTLKSITSNIGYIRGGDKVNLIAAEARLAMDIRIPCGFETKQVIEVLDQVCGRDSDKLGYVIVDRLEPNWTGIDEPVVSLLEENCKDVLERPVTATCRIGASDSAYYREIGIPAVNCGLTAHNPGRADEYIEIDELVKLATVFTLTALDYLAL